MKQQILNSLIQLNQCCTLWRSHVRWPQRWGRGRKLLATAALALCIVVPVRAVIHDTFSDVPASAFYHDAVNAIYRAGITAGCNTGLYCPDQAVTRAQMAVFMQRGLGRIAHNQSPDNVVLTTSFQDLAVININTGGASGQTGFVKLDGTVTAFTPSTTGCPCEITYRLIQDNISGGPTFYYFNLANHTSGVDGTGSGAITWATAVPTNTTRTFRLQMRLSDGGTGTTIYSRGSLTAIYAPFGSTGANTLAAEPSDDQMPFSEQKQDKVRVENPE